MGIKVEVCQVYDRFGEIEKIKEDLPQYLISIGNDDEELVKEVTEIIYKLVVNVILASQKQTAWVSIRAFIPNHEFDIPRWHTDGAYYSPYYSPQYKFAVALKGNQTLFFPIDDEMREVYDAHHDDREFLSQSRA